MLFCTSSKRKLAVGMLAIWTVNVLTPSVSFALTSGPAQPETLSFQPAGVSDMVDLTTGDFKYNIPLLDIDGYPINLNYQSGSGIDDEASWVGLGWNLNLGAINRQLRGVPDDFAGDEMVTDHYTKPKVTIGGRVTAKVETRGKASLGGSFSLGVFSDNYTGIGAEMGANAGISFSLTNGGYLTSGLGVGVLSNTASGVDISPNVSLSIKEKTTQNLMVGPGFSAAIGYNSRGGMKDLTLGASFGVSYSESYMKDGKKKEKDAGAGYGLSSSISYNTEPISPTIQIPYKSSYGSFSFDIGGSAFVVFAGGGGTGYKSVREVKSRILRNPQYGFLYAERGKGRKEAVMDFLREKENPIIPELPNIALPVHTPDLFSYTSQAGSGQFRLYRGGSGAFFDNEVSDESSVMSIGADVGIGAYAHGGVTLFKQETSNTTRKWTKENAYLTMGDFQDLSETNPEKEHVYFKVVGEKGREDTTLTDQIQKDTALAVRISGKEAKKEFRLANGGLATVNKIEKQRRQVKRTMVSYLTGQEAIRNGFDKYVGDDSYINYYPFNNFSSFNPPTGHRPSPSGHTSRVDAIRKSHHISEITVTDEVGKRMLYGIPVYNIRQDEYSFAVGNAYNYSTRRDRYPNQVQLSYSGSSIDNKKGIDHFYHRETQQPYASSFLLTAILSPDYQDKTNDGISYDDNGTALKFNYSKLSANYKWRTPYSKDEATLNKALLADSEDDKASIVYGEKEVWYAHSIESRTKIVYFITEDRDDGLGVKDWQGGADNSVKLKRLREIRIYSKADMNKPIKVVNFKYSYQLCPGIPNSSSGGGKLTLTQVYFTYGNTTKGIKHPYTFNYNTDTVTYGSLKTDRWGVYKKQNNNGNFALANDEFPYTRQGDRLEADRNASIWQLREITLPTGGRIAINYEADDYAYVQNRKAMVMSEVKDLVDGSFNHTESLVQAKGIKVGLTSAERPGAGADTTAWFKKLYLNGKDYLYTKLYVKISTRGTDQYDFIPCYAKVKRVKVDASDARIIFEDLRDGGVTANPVVFASWQRLKEEYPKYAYPGYDNRVKDSDAGKTLEAVVRAIVNSAKNLSELKENFYEKASRKTYADKVILNKSFVRLVKIDGRKIGGGLRVQKISINDDWQQMSANQDAGNASYGQAYDYTTSEDGKEISSGVASYEPSIGNDENPFRQPIAYSQKRKGAISSFFTLEEPFGESFFPAPSVVYSRVKVTDLDRNGVASESPETGFIVNEFYTARDFPVRVTVLPLTKNEYRPKSSFSMISVSSVHELTLSQGYSIELNDMHGKPKAERTYNKQGAEISSTVYYYNSESSGAGEMRLKSSVNVVDQNGSVLSGNIGRDIEFFTDFREQEMTNEGDAVNIGVDIVPFIFGIPLPIPHWPVKENTDYRLFRSASAVKVVQYYGVINKIVKTQNGSSISTENMVFNAETGEPVVTRTQNEFNDYLYSVNLPAYWIYKGMGGAWQNQGAILKDFSTNTNGSILSSEYLPYLSGGDMLADISSGRRYWVIETNGSKRLIADDGSVVPITKALVKIVRSHFRNILQAPAMSLVCMDNPVKDNKLLFADLSGQTAYKILQASATTYNDIWETRDENKFLELFTPMTNTDMNYNWGAARTHSWHGMYGVWVNYGGDSWEHALRTSSTINTSLDRYGIWLSPAELALNEKIGFTKVFYIGTHTNFIGWAGDDYIELRIDGIEMPVSPWDGKVWNIKAFSLQPGYHTVSIAGMNLPLPDGEINSLSSNPGSIGFALYTNTGLNDLLRGQIQCEFSSRQLLEDDIATYRIINGVTHTKYYMQRGFRYFINPYLDGIFGNWRPMETKVYQEARVYPDIELAPVNAPVSRNSGYLKSFTSFWTNSAGPWTINPTSQWITANTVTRYDKYGQELENKDALGRYSAAKFDFNGELPGAVASNAMNREIYVNGFEDNRFTAINSADTAGVHEFSKIGSRQKLYELSTAESRHTGRYSAALPTTGALLQTTVHSQLFETGIKNILELNEKYEYRLKSITGLRPNGFEPAPNKKYLFNAWVKDNHPGDRNLDISLTVNGALVNLECKAIVEGWKLVEGFFVTGASGSTFKMVMAAGTSGILIDDVRIHPYKSHLKSYAYDDRNLRLMAELDENCFATFYEYDDEGSLVRVKKETQRGIMTIRESRSSYRRQNQ